VAYVKCRVTNYFKRGSGFETLPYQEVRSQKECFTEFTLKKPPPNEGVNKHSVTNRTHLMPRTHTKLSSPASTMHFLHISTHSRRQCFTTNVRLLFQAQANLIAQLASSTDRTLLPVASSFDAGDESQFV
jgi:hypothetical protein